MTIKKKAHPTAKSSLHPRNKHRLRYDFEKLIKSCPGLVSFVQRNDFEDYSVDFSNPEAVKTLNKALLNCYYDVDHWDIPPDYLCPPIPGRADYIHYIADLLGTSNNGKISTGNKIKCLDIGVGANCIYPIIGIKEYQWSFIGVDIDPVALASVNQIIKMNPVLRGHIEVRLQPDKKNIFSGIFGEDEYIDVSVCNPPFHASFEEARSGTLRKLNHLTRIKIDKPILNFGGQGNELWCEGGEKSFIGEMIRQSRQFSTACFWFSTLVSKKENLPGIYMALKKVKAIEVKTIQMCQGNKMSRIIAWTFLNADQQKIWVQSRWKRRG